MKPQIQHTLGAGQASDGREVDADDGGTAAADDFHASFDPEADLPGIAAAAGGAYAATVDDPDELPGILQDALAVVRGGRSAVISVHLPPV